MALLILLVLVATVIGLIWHTYRREKARIKSILRDLQAIKNPRGSKPKGTLLEQDPKTGEYRPVKED